MVTCYRLMATGAHRAVLDALQLKALAAALQGARLEERVGGGQRADGPVGPLVLLQQPISARSLSRSRVSVCLRIASKARTALVLALLPAGTRQPQHELSACQREAGWGKAHSRLNLRGRHRCQGALQGFHSWASRGCHLEATISNFKSVSISNDAGKHCETPLRGSGSWS